MADQRGAWPPIAPPPGYVPPHHPLPVSSGLLTGPPRRPVYREPHPVAARPVLSGVGATVLWFVLFGSLGHDLASYAWWTLLATATAWLVALVLSLVGDRGVAVGTAATSAVGCSIAVVFVAARWIATYDWPLW